MLPYLEFLTSNRLIKYPFAEAAPLPATWPLDLIVDLAVVTSQWQIPWAITRVEVQATTLTLTFTTGLTITVARGVTPLTLATTSNATGYLKVLFGHTDLPWTNGIYTFTDQLMLESCCVAPRGAIVTTLNTIDQAVTLQPGYNTELTPDGATVTIAFRPGAGAGNPPCVDPVNPGIYTVNGVACSGNLSLLGSDCIEIRPEAAVPLVVVHDRCQPCCGNCDGDLQTINTAVDLAAVAIADLDARLSVLEGA